MASRFVTDLLLREAMSADEVDRLLMNADNEELLEIISLSVGYHAEKAREILEKRGVTVPKSEEKAE